jgi:hypothetical protein
LAELSDSGRNHATLFANACREVSKARAAHAGFAVQAVEKDAGDHLRGGRQLRISDDLSQQAPLVQERDRGVRFGVSFFGSLLDAAVLARNRGGGRFLRWWMMPSPERLVNILRDYFGSFRACSVLLVPFRSDFGFGKSDTAGG